MFANQFGSHTKGVECGLIRLIKRTEWQQETAPIPLQSVSVVASVVHAVAQVEVTQIFINKEEQPIEAIYYFPVDSNGAVTHFEAEVEGRKIKGIVKAHEEAKEQYEKAIEHKQTAFLAEENKPDIFKVRVGFLKPGSQAKIIIGYTTEVKNEKDSNSIRFFIPTTVAPRYVPKRCDDEKSQDLANMVFTNSSPAPMSIKVNVSIQGGIKTIESPTHSVKISDKGPVAGKELWTKAFVQLTGETTDMDRDFVLLVTPEETHKPRLYVEKQENSLAVMAHLIPSFKLDEQNAELIFVLDRSGSMMGDSIELAKKALTLFLHSLPMDCYFNIIGFGSTYEFLFPKSVKYDDNTLKIAAAHAKQLDANMGGTEILEPLKKIFASETIPGYLRQIFVITDGEVGNTEEVIGLTKAKAHESRLFSLGIGDGASHHLVEGIAAAGGGTSAFVTYKETVDTKVLQQLKNALQPSLTNVRISWHDVTPSEPQESEKPKPVEVNKEKTLLGYGKPKESESENVEKSTASTNESAPKKKSYRQAPEKIPPIFDGSQLLVFGVFEGEEKPTGATITADSPDGPLSIDIQLSEENDVGATGMLHKLAAIKIVREIELKVAALGFSSYNEDSNSDAKKLEEGFKKEVIEIAVPQGIASKYTSFIAVDTESDEKSSENWVMQSRLVPNQFTHGWHGRSTRMMCGGGPQLAYCSAPMPTGMSLKKCSMAMPQQMKSFSYSRSAKTRASPTYLYGGACPGERSAAAGAVVAASQLQFEYKSNSSLALQADCALIERKCRQAPSIAKRSKTMSYDEVDSSPPTASFFNSPITNTPSYRSRPRAGFSLEASSTNSTFGASSTGFSFGAPSTNSPFVTLSSNSCFTNNACADEADDDMMETESPEPEQVQEVSDPLERLVSFQSFNGSFNWSEEFFQAIGLDFSLMKQEAEKQNWDTVAFATALALAYLSEKLQERKDSWELVAMKANKWLAKNHSAISDALIQAAKKFFN